MNIRLLPAARLLLAGLSAITAFSCSGGPDRPREHRRVVLPAGEIHEGWYFAAGDQVIISGTIIGDAYVAAGMVQVDGEIEGDLLVAGGAVTVNGRVSDDVRAGGGNVECNGTIGKNLTVAGGSVRVGNNARIGGGVLGAAGTVMLGGHIMRDVMLGAGEVTVNGRVDGNATVACDAISLLPGGRVNGDLKVRTENKDRVEIAPEAVGGTVDIVSSQPRDSSRILGMRSGFFWFKLVWTLSLIATTLVWILLLPNHLSALGAAILNRPGWCALWGVAGTILIPVSALILAVTFVGIPLAILVVAIYLWFVYLSQLSLGVAFGLRALGGDGRWRTFLASAAGIILVQGLTSVPYLGVLLVFAGLVMGMGALMLLIYDHTSPRASADQ